MAADAAQQAVAAGRTHRSLRSLLRSPLNGDNVRRIGRMRIWFDTNAAIDERRYRLSCAGTVRDLRALGVALRTGMKLTLYMEDSDETGRPELLVVDAVVEEFGGELVAHVDSATWRREVQATSAV